ncbi:MAG: flagellar protein FlaG [Bacillota bacterium]
MSIGSVSDRAGAVSYTTPIRQGESAAGKTESEASAAVETASEGRLSTEKEFIKAIEKANKDVVMDHTSLKFSIHEGTKQIMVKIVDSETQEVVKEIPPEKILDMVAYMIENTGLFVDKKV